MIYIRCYITSYNKNENYEFYNISESNSGSIISGIDVPIDSKSDIRMPSWGVVSNNANVYFSKYGADTLISKVRSGHLSKNDRFQIFLHRDKDIWRRVFSGYVKSISDDGKTLQLNDGLEDWQNRIVPRKDYNWDTPSATAKDAYEYLRDFSWQLGSTKDELVPSMPTFGELNPETQDILSNTTIPNYFIEESNLWDQYNKLCTLCMCYIYKQDLNAKFEYKGGR